MRKFFRKLYKLIDVLIVVPISRLIYNIQKALKKNGGLLDKLLNKPNFLIFLSLILAIVLFLLVDSKAISFVEDKTEVISNVPVNIKYNEEAYVVEGAPTDVNIMISGRKSDIYLAKQLGEYEVTLDLTEYTASDTAYKVYFTYAKSINSDSTFNVLSYISSHDTDLGGRGDLISAGTALLLTPGAAQIFYGDETGRQKQWENFCANNYTD